MKLTDFKALAFDCYGTLVDWESGMVEALKALTRACKIVGCLTPRAAQYDCHCPSGKLGSAA
jgi:phosphoglycolate phosphatase-like HAD superfamily hydrolase